MPIPEESIPTAQSIQLETNDGNLLPVDQPAQSFEILDQEGLESPPKSSMDIVIDNKTKVVQKVEKPFQDDTIAQSKSEINITKEDVESEPKHSSYLNTILAAEREFLSGYQDPGLSTKGLSYKNKQPQKKTMETMKIDSEGPEEEFTIEYFEKVLGFKFKPTEPDQNQEEQEPIEEVFKELIIPALQLQEQSEGHKTPESIKMSDRQPTNEDELIMQEINQLYNNEDNQ